MNRDLDQQDEASAKAMAGGEAGSKKRAMVSQGAPEATPDSSLADASSPVSRDLNHSSRMEKKPRAELRYPSESLKATEIATSDKSDSLRLGGKLSTSEMSDRQPLYEAPRQAESTGSKLLCTLVC